MPMTMTQRAARLGISFSHLDKIYKGSRFPSWKLVERWRTEALICKGYKWWRGAELKDIQAAINKVQA